ncbi:hypothetical protein E1292_23865 [Nonomuraea deserti]|uniref:Uncharacterized protein n=1 Tax=Nonomuraea deserti TaxID=1848322 RepID=A0A4V2YA46_9ACTN|nr:hypothetical protein [Nonomuraea deserti]TDD02316.1 hypothetical protein E1292_23865 [Nonomuraea deserti]
MKAAALAEVPQAWKGRPSNGGALTRSSASVPVAFGERRPLQCEHVRRTLRSFVVACFPRKLPGVNTWYSIGQRYVSISAAPWWQYLGVDRDDGRHSDGGLGQLS